MNTKHTPGPWWFCATEEESRFVAGAGDKELTKLISKDDARLIAAAPDLLEMLDRAVRRLEIAHANGDSIMREWVIDARAAIKKATGG